MYSPEPICGLPSSVAVLLPAARVEVAQGAAARRGSGAALARRAGEVAARALFPSASAGLHRTLVHSTLVNTRAYSIAEPTHRAIVVAERRDDRVHQLIYWRIQCAKPVCIHLRQRHTRSCPCMRRQLCKTILSARLPCC